MKKIVQI